MGIDSSVLCYVYGNDADANGVDACAEVSDVEDVLRVYENYENEG